MRGGKTPNRKQMPWKGEGSITKHHQALPLRTALAKHQCSEPQSLKHTNQASAKKIRIFVMGLCDGKTPTSFLIYHVPELCARTMCDEIERNLCARSCAKPRSCAFSWKSETNWNPGVAVVNHKFKSNWKLTSKENHRSQRQKGKLDQPKKIHCSQQHPMTITIFNVSVINSFTLSGLPW